jgi:hypothetical protein
MDFVAKGIQFKELACFKCKTTVTITVYSLQ